MAEQAPQFSAMRQMRPETSAWLTLIGFFTVFCALVAGAGYAGWRYYATAMQPVNDHRVVAYTTGVMIQPKNLTTGTPLGPMPNGADRGVAFPEGYRIKTVPATSYGQVASLLLHDQSQIDLWAYPAGADLELLRYQVSRWTAGRQEVAFRQHAGYMRYDLHTGQPFGQVSYSVQIAESQVWVTLEPGGSYSINLPRDGAGRPQPLLVTDTPLLAEVAVRKGAATVSNGETSITIRPHEKLQVELDSALSDPMPAHWQLIADSNFTQYSQQGRYIAEANPKTWMIYYNLSDQSMRPEELRGSFLVSRKCSPITPDICPKSQVPVGQFLRDGGQTRTLITGIRQDINADVSEYTSLRFSVWVRVLNQSVPSAGVDGSECPIMITLNARLVSPDEKDTVYRACVYTGAPSPVTRPEIDYYPIPQFQWYQIKIELRDPENQLALQDVRYLKDILIEARGHDYSTEISNVSLIGTP